MAEAGAAFQALVREYAVFADHTGTLTVALNGTSYESVPGNSPPALNGIELWLLLPTNQVMVMGEALVRAVGSRGASVALGRTR